MLAYVYLAFALLYSHRFILEEKKKHVFKKEIQEKAEQTSYHWATERLGGRGPTGQQPQLQTIIDNDEWC